jgi:hypothetical protein
VGRNLRRFGHSPKRDHAVAGHNLAVLWVGLEGGAAIVVGKRDVGAFERRKGMLRLRHSSAIAIATPSGFWLGIERDGSFPKETPGSGRVSGQPVAHRAA